MRTPIFQVDAFATLRFAGNPAALLPMNGFLTDAVLQAVAAENHLAETAFLVPQGSDYLLRWFTPTTEVPPYDSSQRGGRHGAPGAGRTAT